MTEPAPLILSPHPDDAVLSLWHVLTAPAEVRVLNVFAGTPNGAVGDRWWDLVTAAGDSEQRVRERHEEDRAALALAGRAPENLDFLDGQYRDAEPAVEAVAERIAALANAGTLLYAPAALAGHLDHRLTLDAALLLAARGHRVVIYADIPHATEYGWPSWVSGAEEEPNLDPMALWEARFASAGLTLADLPAKVSKLDAEQAERKLEAVRRYRSQFAALEAQFHMTRPGVLGHEVVWTLPV